MLNHRRRALAWSLASAVAVVAPLGCTVEDAITTVVCPPAEEGPFRTVSKVLELRCGTLDCHGNSFRPLRIYGQTGLRKPVIPDKDTGELPPDSGITADQFPDYYTGGLETTTAELLENARSICGIEPEEMKTYRDAVNEKKPITPENPVPTFADISQLASENLTIIRKARLVERHKGGKIWDEGDASDRCLASWLGMLAEGTAPPGDCDAALEEARR